MKTKFMRLGVVLGVVLLGMISCFREEAAAPPQNLMAVVDGSTIRISWSITGTSTNCSVVRHDGLTISNYGTYAIDENPQMGNNTYTVTNYTATGNSASSTVSCYYTKNDNGGNDNGGNDNGGNDNGGNNGGNDNQEALSCAEAVQAAIAQGSTASETEYMVKGYVTSITSDYSSEYENISFYIADSKNGGEVFFCHRTYPISTNDIPSVGDFVLCTGKILNYQGNLPEMQYGKVEILQKSNNNGGGSGDNGGTTAEAPTNVKATATDNGIRVTWTGCSNSVFYAVARATDKDNSFYIISDAIVGTTSFTDYSPETGNNYYLVANFYDETGENYVTSEEYATCYWSGNTSGGNDNGGSGNGGGNDNGGSGNGGTTPTKPAKPTGVTAKQVGNTIEVSWNSVSGAFAYLLYYINPSKNENFIDVYTNSYTFKNCKEGTYTFWVHAMSSDGTIGDASSRVTCTYKDNSSGGNGGSGGNDTPSKLDAPTNLEAVTDFNYVQISFDAVPLASEYELYRSTKASSGYKKISASGGSTSSGKYVLTDQNPLSGTSYYKVKAIPPSYLGIGASDYSNYVKVTR